MLRIIVAFCAGGLFGFLVLGYRIRRALRELERLGVNDELPVDSLLTFAMYDAEGNQLTERAMFSVGPDGSNKRLITTKVIRNGIIHHGVAFVGEIGSILDIHGTNYVTVGDTYAIPPGNWNTDFRPL